MIALATTPSVPLYLSPDKKLNNQCNIQITLLPLSFPIPSSLWLGSQKKKNFFPLRRTPLLLGGVDVRRERKRRRGNPPPPLPELQPSPSSPAAPRYRAPAAANRAVGAVTAAATGSTALTAESSSRRPYSAPPPARGSTRGAAEREQGMRSRKRERAEGMRLAASPPAT